MNNENNGWISVKDELPSVFDHNGFVRSDIMLVFGLEEYDVEQPTV